MSKADYSGQEVRKAEGCTLDVDRAKRVLSKETGCTSNVEVAR